jgi:hypothetical protein
MTKADLIKLLEEYPDDTKIVCEEQYDYGLCSYRLRQYPHLPGFVVIVPGDPIIMSSL